MPIVGRFGIVVEVQSVRGGFSGYLHVALHGRRLLDHARHGRIDWAGGVDLAAGDSGLFADQGEECRARHEVRVDRRACLQRFEGWLQIAKDRGGGIHEYLGAGARILQRACLESRGRQTVDAENRGDQGYDDADAERRAASGQLSQYQRKLHLACPSCLVTYLYSPPWAIQRAMAICLV